MKELESFLTTSIEILGSDYDSVTTVIRVIQKKDSEVIHDETYRLKDNQLITLVNKTVLTLG